MMLVNSSAASWRRLTLAALFTIVFFAGRVVWADEPIRLTTDGRPHFINKAGRAGVPLLQIVKLCLDRFTARLLETQVAR
jgi:hypothetical protein